MGMEISLKELEKCFSLLFRHLRRGGIREVGSGSHDYYWVVLNNEWLVFDKEPKPAVGSLDDDIAELKELAKGPSRLSSVDFERLAAILKFIASPC